MKKINICFKCEIYRKDLGEEREVEADGMNVQEEALFGNSQSILERGHYPRGRGCSCGSDSRP